jgi:glycosyltransferase involved in cell wall biosynthesis
MSLDQQPSVFLVIATKGRPAAVNVLLDYCRRQTRSADQIIIVGAGPEDVAGLSEHPLAREDAATIVISDQAGLTHQRNRGIDWLKERNLLGAKEYSAIVVFFDDDFRPANDWLASAEKVFSSDPSLVALTGRILADGVRGDEISEGEAQEFISAARPPQHHWASGDRVRDLSSMYGCNMAFRETPFVECRFDERLPLYAWQEDRDFTGQCARFGRTIYTPECRGVHLGIKSGRVNGLRFGYSQISNPIYLAAKGTVSVGLTAKLLARALLSNLLRSWRLHPIVDYRGRLKGNMRALWDFCIGRCRPEKITEL